MLVKSVQKVVSGNQWQLNLHFKTNVSQRKVRLSSPMCLLAYAVARDAACWQLARPEPQVCDLLASLEACHASLRSSPLTD